MKLAIISHTTHFIQREKIVGWGPTVREVNYLAELFDEVYHIAPFYKKPAPGSSMPYEKENISYIPLKPYGGEDLSSKFSVISTAPHNLGVIRKVLKRFGKTDWVHFRSPTAMGLYVLPYLSINRRSKLWVKYAGNWKMKNPPATYAFQKWWLEKNLQRSKVTINGYWKGQKEHLIDFKNPCYSEKELLRANQISASKKFNEKLTICFSGSLTKNKGAEILLKAIKEFSLKNEIEEVIITGDGILRSHLEKVSESSGVRVTFRGYISREDMGEVYSKSHLIVLPSESEGFPKVIAEAASYGCVPIVSNVSSISQTFDSGKGYLLRAVNVSELVKLLEQAFGSRKALELKSKECIKISSFFTYENYVRSLKEKILSD